jgi:hypothetical protein
MTIDRIAQDFFVGVEVENSPAKGTQTLFVVGRHDAATIVNKAKNCRARHIYIGANMSLHGVANDDHFTWRQWEAMVDAILSQTAHAITYITVDIESSQIEGFLDSRMSEDNRIIPMISVKLPYMKLLNYNTTIKLDDKGFDQTNPGVWCHSLHDLMDKNTYTPWSAYQGDSPIN